MTGGRVTIPTPKRTSRTTDTRAKIVSAAAELLAEVGYTATSLDEVAERAGLTKGTIYYHFDSKEDLYWSVVFPEVEATIESAKGIAERESDPLRALHRIFHASTRRVRDPRQKYMYYQEMLPLRPDMREAIRAREREYEAIVTQLIRKGQERGELVRGNPKVMALIAIGTVARTARWYDARGEVPGEEFSRTLLRAILRGLLRDGAALPEDL
jgi:AcrR family transcriptional regulator